MDRTADPQGINRFSHFEEFMKKKELRLKRDTDPTFMNLYGEWVLAGKLPNAIDVRHLPAILANEEAYKKFLKSGIQAAQKVLFENNPSLVSNLYSSVDQTAVELENISLSEITAIQEGDKVKVEKIKRLVKAITRLEKISEAKFTPE
jgi:hypothetical protein